MVDPHDPVIPGSSRRAAYRRRTIPWWSATTAASMPIATALSSDLLRALFRSGDFAGVNRLDVPGRCRFGCSWESPAARSASGCTRHHPPSALVACRAGAPTIRSTGAAREADTGDHLFHEPEVHPKFVSAGVPPGALTWRRPVVSGLSC